MKKIYTILIISIISASSLFAGIDSISGNIGFLATSVAIERKLDSKSQLYIPLGINLLNTAVNYSTPFYFGAVYMKANKEYIPKENNFQLKYGAGAEVFMYPDRDTDELNIAIFPILSAELEQHFNQKHSMFIRSTPTLAFINTDFSSVEFSFLQANDVIQYLLFMGGTMFSSLSIGYRYTY